MSAQDWKDFRTHLGMFKIQISRPVNEFDPPNSPSVQASRCSRRGGREATAARAAGRSKALILKRTTLARSAETRDRSAESGAIFTGAKIATARQGFRGRRCHLSGFSSSSGLLSELRGRLLRLLLDVFVLVLVLSVGVSSTRDDDLDLADRLGFEKHQNLGARGIRAGDRQVEPPALVGEDAGMDARRDDQRLAQPPVLDGLLEPGLRRLGNVDGHLARARRRGE